MKLNDPSTGLSNKKDSNFIVTHSQALLQSFPFELSLVKFYRNFLRFVG